MTNPQKRQNDKKETNASDQASNKPNPLSNDSVIQEKYSQALITVNSSRYSKERTPMEHITGNTPDISEYLDLQNWIMHLEEPHRHQEKNQ